MKGMMVSSSELGNFLSRHLINFSVRFHSLKYISFNLKESMYTPNAYGRVEMDKSLKQKPAY